jgi:hypothetical protein
MIDKSDTEIAAIKTVFPDSEIRICLFHVLQAWQRWMRASSNNVPRKPAQSEKKLFFGYRKKKIFVCGKKKFSVRRGCAEVSTGRRERDGDGDDQESVRGQRARVSLISDAFGILPTDWLF